MIIEEDHLSIPLCAKASCLLGAPYIMSPVIRSLLKGLPESGVLKKEKKRYAGLLAAEPHSGRIVISPPPMPMVF